MGRVKKAILGVDLSLNASGLCYRDRRGTYTFYETNFTSSMITSDRWEGTVKIVLDFARKSDIIFIEDYAHGAKGSAKSSLYELGGIIRYELGKIPKTFYAVPPTSLKKFVTGKGNCPKSLILKEVYKRWNADVDSDNIADAFGLVKMAEGCLGMLELTKAQTEVLKKLDYDFCVPLN